MVILIFRESVNMLKYGKMLVKYLDSKNNLQIIIGIVTINNDIVDIDNGKILIFKERIVSMSKECDFYE